MATSNNSRDVKMTLSVETLGAEDIKSLQSSVASLAKQGGDAAPEFQRLADEIARLGQQAAALQVFQQLAAETGTLAQQQEHAVASAAELKAKLEALSSTTQEAAAKQRESVAALAAARQAARETRDELALLSATTDRASKTEADYTEAVQKLKLAKIEQRAEVERLSAALTAANAEVKQAEAAESKLAGAYKQASAAAAEANQSLQANSAEVVRAADAAHALGITVDNVAASQAELVQGLNQAGSAAKTLETQVERLADRQRELEGIRAFEKQAEDAKRMVTAGQYAELFDESLRRLTETEQAMKDQSNVEKWQRESAALVDAAESAKKLAHDVDLLAAVERELAAQAAFEKQAEDARKLVQAGEYVRFWRDELDKAEAQAQQTALAAQTASQKISDAFRTLGVRSAQELQTEIVQVRAAMETVRGSAASTGQALDGAFAAGEAKVKALEREIRATSGTLTVADKAAKIFSNSLSQIAAGNIIADGVGYLVNKVKELGRAFLEAVVQGDQMRRGLGAIYGDAAIVTKQIDFLRKSSSESGVAFGQLTGEFVKFSAAMKISNIPLEQSNNLFKAITAASASLGLGTEATAGALGALSQMASKGVVSMEELRQQLGDRLPGAVGLAAKGLGITEAQLFNLVQTGQLATRDFIVPFTEALKTMQGETDSLVPAYDRFKGLLSETAQSMGEAGGAGVLLGALKLLGGFVGALTLGLSALVEGLFLVGSGVTALAARMMGDTKAWEFFGDQVEKSTKRLTSQANAFNAFLEPAQAATDATAKHTVGMTAHTAEVVKSISANTSLTGVQKMVALSTALAADATLSASAKIVQYTVASVELLAQQSAQTDAYTKAAKAAKQQGDTLVELAKLTGDTTTIQKASVAAAELQSAALDKVAVSQSAETDTLIAQKAELLASAAARGLAANDIKGQADALDKLIVKSQAETEQAVQASASAKAALFDRQLAIDKLKDHSAETGKYQQAMEAAAVTLQEYQRLALNGKKTDEDVTAARRELIAATALYKDSLADSISKLDLETRAKQANLQMSVSLSSTAQKHSEVMAAQARAIGDTTMATYYDIQAKEQSIATIKLEMQMKALEAEAALKTIELKRLEITGTDELSKKKLAILDIEAALIKVKLAGNEAAKETIRGIENEINALRDGTAARGASTAGIHADTSARGSNRSAMDEQADALDRIAMKYLMVSQYTERQIALLERETAATEKAIAAENKRLNRDKEGFSLNTAGQRVNMAVDSQRSVYEGAKSQGLSEAQALQISNQFMTQQGEKVGWSGANVNAGENWGTELQKAIDKIVLTNAANTANTATGTTTASGTTAPMVVPGAPVTVTTVNINIGGRSTPVNVASQADAAALTSVLRQLESGKGTSA